MIIRAILGLVLSGGLTIGALYGAGEFLGIRGATAHEIADIEPGEPEGDVGPDTASIDPMPDDAGEDEPIYDVRLPLPYGEGDAAGWLADALAGSGPYDVDGQSVDIAAIAARAAAGDGASVTCDSSHVAFHCNLIDEVADVRYGFGLQNNAEGGYEIPDGNVRTYEVN